MKKKRFSVEQIVAVLKQAELGIPVADIIRKMDISEQTFYRWKKQYAGLQSDQVRELKQLQDENARLKKLVAELSLDKAILQDVASKPGAARAEEKRSGLHREPLRLQDAAGLPAGQTNAKHAVLPQRQGSAPEFAGTNARDRTRPRSLWISAHPCASQAGGVEAGQGPDVPPLPGRAVAAALEVAQAAQDG